VDLGGISADSNAMQASGDRRSIDCHTCSTADDVEDTLLRSILRNAQHVLQPYLEERPQLHYNLRNRPGMNKTLVEKTVDLSDRDFIVRNLFEVSY